MSTSFQPYLLHFPLIRSKRTNRQPFCAKQVRYGSIGKSKANCNRRFDCFKSQRQYSVNFLGLVKATHQTRTPHRPFAWALPLSSSGHRPPTARAILTIPKGLRNKAKGCGCATRRRYPGKVREIVVPQRGYVRGRERDHTEPRWGSADWLVYPG